MTRLSEKVDKMSDPAVRETSDKTLAEIREVTSSLNQNVQEISKTLTALSEEV